MRCKNALEKPDGGEKSPLFNKRRSSRTNLDYKLLIVFLARYLKFLFYFFTLFNKDNRNANLGKMVFPSLIEVIWLTSITVKRKVTIAFLWIFAKHFRTAFFTLSPGDCFWLNAKRLLKIWFLFNINILSAQAETLTHSQNENIYNPILATAITWYYFLTTLIFKLRFTYLISWDQYSQIHTYKTVWFLNLLFVVFFLLFEPVEKHEAK